MPNHIHGIVVFNDVGAHPCGRPGMNDNDNSNARAGTRLAPTEECGDFEKGIFKCVTVNHTA